MICKICLSKRVRKFSFNYPSFEHSSYKILKKNFSRYECKNCKIIFSDKNQKKINNFFFSKKYKQHLENHTYQKKKLSIPKNLYQAKIIYKKISKDKNDLNILDYGCFDGALLKALSSYKNVKKLIGFDIIRSSNLIKNKKINYIINNENNLFKNYKKTFDVIIFSHSINYIPNLKKKMTNIVDLLLKDDGFIFIQNPDLNKKYLNIFFDDQNYFFSKYSLANFIHRIDKNLHIEIVSDQLIPNDTILFAKKKNTPYLFSKIIKKNQMSLYKILKKIILDIKKYKIIEKKNQPLFIFGTTIDAIIASYFVKKNVSAFIDDNIFKINSFINGLKVINPKNLPLNSMILIPFSMKSKKNLIKRFLHKKYTIF